MLTRKSHRQTGYIEAYNKSSGSILGRVVCCLFIANLHLPDSYEAKANLNALGGFTLTESNTPTDWLKVERWDTCSGDPNFFKIIDSPNPSLGYISLIDGITTCSSSIFGGLAKWAVIAPADGNSQSPYPTPGATITTVHQGGSWSKTGGQCGESMVFQRSGDVLVPTWKNPDGTLLTLLSFYDGASSTLAAISSLSNYDVTSAISEVSLKLAADPASTTSSTSLASSSSITASFVPVASSSKSPIAAIVGGVLGGLGLMLLVSIAILCIMRRQKRRTRDVDEKRKTSDNTSSPGPDAHGPSSSQNFGFTAINSSQLGTLSPTNSVVTSAQQQDITPHAYHLPTVGQVGQTGPHSFWNAGATPATLQQNEVSAGQGSSNHPVGKKNVYGDRDSKGILGASPASPPSYDQLT
ncbi:hypothetical protein DL96DRAFT_1596580 [Flagelloscypha sp. PMI_526]|nr:hypothetical protein DL96DRAFT_1596580 [Flagelloscypha sp. PMI_526]